MTFTASWMQQSLRVRAQTAAQKHFNTAKLTSVRKMVQAKKVRTAKDYKLPGWISNVLRGEDLLLSVLVVELDNVFMHNLYLKDEVVTLKNQIIWKLSGTFPKGRPIKLINPNLEKYQIFKMSPALTEKPGVFMMWLRMSLAINWKYTKSECNGKVTL